VNSLNDADPLEVLLKSMQKYWREDQIDKAVVVARAAAPYVHPRAAKRGVETNSILEVGHLSDAVLASRIAAARARVESSGIDSHGLA
jgi:hypothetical protein